VRNLNKPPRYNVASVQAQQTLGGDVMQSHEQGDYVEFRDYQWLLTEKQRLDSLTSEMDKTINASQAECRRLKAELTDLKSTADRFEVENSILMKETYRLMVEVKSLMTNPTSRLLRAEREENARLKAEVERLTKAGDVMAEWFFDSDSLVANWQAAKGGKTK